MNQIITEIAEGQKNAKRSTINVAYLAGYITKDERDVLQWRITVGLPV